jgi:antitoxin (DNA-binding transcriptional repressor) of toxin-antitoxin stability system
LLRAASPFSELTAGGECVTLWHMKRVTLRELHENTGTLIREAVRLGGLVVTDHGTPIARIEPTSRPTIDKPFKRRRILPAYQEFLDARALQGGTDSTQIIEEDRDSR